MFRWLVVPFFVLSSTFTVFAGPIELKKGDRICIIGNALAERMQHFAWFEAYLHSRFPSHDLVVRNIAFAADELTIRLRSDGFESTDAWLASQKADVIFAFFGFNESFAGEAGLAKFRGDLEAFIKSTSGQKYNGQSPPRLVLFSPIAHENVKNANLPDGATNNARLKQYSAAMAEVARAHQIPFVDLFEPSLALYGKAAKPLTINGIHLSEAGDEQLASVMENALFGPAPERRDSQYLQKLRSAVQDKNFHWFHRYRTTDGYSTYGGRADLKFTDGQTNRVVVQRELEILDEMTANRDRRVWAAAQNKELAVDDSNTKPFIPVITNARGDGPGGSHIFLSGKDAIQRMTVGKGLKVTLFASEEKFPDLINPVQMAFDTKGRLWVATWPSYPHWIPKDDMNDKLLILEDTDGNGAADKCTVFADKLHNPTGFEFWNGGVIVANAPDLLFLKDVDGDDKADVRERIVHGIDSADTHHTANSFVLDPGGALYFQEGTFHRTQSETPYGPMRNINACVWRFEPRTWKLERYIPYDFANPHGHVFDRWGQDIVVDGTGANPFHGTLFSGHLDFPKKHNRPPQVYQQRTRPCPAIEILSSRHFPPEWQGNLIVGNVITVHGLLHYKISDKGSSFTGTELEPILFSKDRNFRPADIEIGPDGAIWFTDWHNPIIGHMQHNLRDPSRDKTHGRVYRVTYDGRELLKPARIFGEPIEVLLNLLKEPEDRVRYRVRIELSGRKADEVVAAVTRWLDALNPADPDFEHHRLEALWLLQNHNIVNEDLLKKLLRSPDFRVRAAATRVLVVWRDRLRDPIGLLTLQTEDEHPRVRLEGVRACSFFNDIKAADAALRVLKHPTDEYLLFTLRETMFQLEPLWKKAVASGADIAADNPAGTNFLLRGVSANELVGMRRSPMVFQALLARDQIAPDYRVEALAGLAKHNRSSMLAELLAAVERLDRGGADVSESALHDLGHLMVTWATSTGASHGHAHGHAGAKPTASEVKASRGQFAKLAANAVRPYTRQIAYVTLFTIDQALDPTWTAAAQKSAHQKDLLDAVPLIPDMALRAAAHDRILPLLSAKPADPNEKPAVNGRYVRVELPRRGTLTLAEVQVFSGGTNIARGGEAKQSTTAHGGVASRAIDGNTSGVYGDGGQTHTAENDAKPWWELDLKAEKPIESIAIWNRSEGNGQFVSRLDGFRLVVLDSGRQMVFEKRDNAAPRQSVRFDLGSDQGGLIRRSAINAIVATGKDTEATFKMLAGFIREGRDRSTVVRAIGRIPKTQWPHTELPGLIETILKFVRQLPENTRTSPEVRDALQLGNELASLLPAKQAQAARAALRELGVPVIVVRPVPHLMLYDRSVIFVEAGKPIEIVFENTDVMPHNFIVAKPGSLEKVGIAAEKMSADPSAFDRHFVPNLPEVLHSTRMLQPQQSDHLVFKAPVQLGDYVYVCTFPGHWRRMYGTLRVVRSLDDVSPEELAASLTPIKETAIRPFVRAWTVADLQGSIKNLNSGRNLVRGKELFAAISCIQCHRMNGVGGQVGPDLIELQPRLTDKKLSPLDVLTELIEPSKVINEKYRTTVFELKNGKVVSGLVVAQTEKEIHLRSNPLDQKDDRPIVIKRDEIDEKTESKVSLMPIGLLNSLTEDEVLDLMAYVLSGGK